MTWRGSKRAAGPQPQWVTERSAVRMAERSSRTSWRSSDATIRLTFQAADRTLTDAEVNQSVETILAALVREHNAVQR